MSISVFRGVKKFYKMSISVRKSFTKREKSVRKVIHQQLKQAEDSECHAVVESFPTRIGIQMHPQLS